MGSEELLKQVVYIVIAIMMLQITVFAESTGSIALTGEDSAFNLDEQFDALGRDELETQVPEQAKALMRENDTLELSPTKLLQLSPKNFFAVIWNLAANELEKPIRTLAAVVGVMVLCAFLGGLKTAAGENSLSRVFATVSVLCVLVSIIKPIFDCVIDTSQAIKDVALFMLSYIPMFGAALTASGSPITGTTYNMLLLMASQTVSQVISRTLIPLMGIYLALCVIGSLVPEINISSAAGTIKNIISWTLGFFLTAFVGLFSVQTMVAQSADTVAVRATKFMIGSFVPVVGGALSEAYSAAQGCFKLIKTTLGAYGVIVTIFTFLPLLIRTFCWYFLTNLAIIAGDILGVRQVSGILRSCMSVLGILLAIIFCFALLMIVSTTIVMVAGMGI